MAKVCSPREQEICDRKDQEGTMAENPKGKRVLQAPKQPPDSFTRSELLKAIKKVAAARRRRQQASVSDASK